MAWHRAYIAGTTYRRHRHSRHEYIYTHTLHVRETRIEGLECEDSKNVRNVLRNGMEWNNWKE